MWRSWHWIKSKPQVLVKPGLTAALGRSLFAPSVIALSILLSPATPRPALAEDEAPKIEPPPFQEPAPPGQAAEAQSLPPPQNQAAPQNPPPPAPQPPPARQQTPPPPQAVQPQAVQQNTGLSPPPQQMAPPAQAAKLPDIEARSYNVSVARRSQSQKTYLLADPTDSRPKVGKIILLRRGDTPIMAFRVLKLYPDKKQFAAKRVRLYGNNEVLENGDSFLGIEKIADITPPPETPQDKADLKELEGGVGSADEPLKDYDPELDAGSSPSPEERDEANENTNESISVEEFEPMERTNQSISASFGYYRNVAATGESVFFSGGGIRYSMAIGRYLAFHRNTLQDSLVLDFGIHAYKIVNFASTTANDSYNVVPLTAAVRYNIMYSENLATFFYAGLVQNNVLSATNPDPDTQQSLSSILPDLGMGFLFRVGPSWDARIDLGVDFLGFGLMLRF